MEEEIEILDDYPSSKKKDELKSNKSNSTSKKKKDNVSKKIQNTQTKIIENLVNVDDDEEKRIFDENEDSKEIEKIINHKSNKVKEKKSNIVKNESKDSAKTDKEKKKKILLRNIKVLVIKIVFIIVLIYVMFFWIFGLTRIDDLAMHPTIASGDLLIYYRLDKDYHVGDVVTFKKNGKRYILRILATQGETVSLNADNELINSGAQIEKETLFKDSIPESSSVKYPYKVEKGKVFVVGDYRLESDDSREFGAIDISIIDGKVISLLQTKDI